MIIGICDDDDYMIQTVQQMIDQYPKNKPAIEVVTFQNGQSMLASQRVFDLVILDVQMPEIDGIAVAKKLQEKDKDTMIMFISSHGQYIRIGYQLGAFQFLLKPIDPVIFYEELERAFLQYNRQHQAFTINNRGEQYQIMLGDIVYIQSEKRLLVIYTSDGQAHRTYGKIADEEKNLVPYSFICCSRGYLVNLKYVKEIEGTTLYLKHQWIKPIKGSTMALELIISKRKLKQINSAFNQYFARTKGQKNETSG